MSPPRAPASPGGSAFARFLGIEVLEAGRGRARIGLDIRPEFMNAAGLAHGAIPLAIMDTACGVALTADRDAGVSGRVLTVSFTVSYLAAVREGRLEATAQSLGGGRRLLTCDARVHDEAGRIVAAGQGVFRRLRAEAPEPR